MEKTSLSQQSQEIPLGIPSSQLNIGKIQSRIKNKKLVFGQIMILILGTLALSWALGSEIGLVNAETITYRATSGSVTGTYSTSTDCTYCSGIGGATYYVNSQGGGAKYLAKDSSGQWYYVGNDGKWTKYGAISQSSFQVTQPDANPSLQEVVVDPTDKKPTVTSIPAKNNQQTFPGGYQYDAGVETYADPVTGETKYQQVNQEAYPIPQNQQEKNQEKNNNVNSDWSWYNHLFGTRNTYTYKDRTYYYETNDDGSKTWYKVDGGDTIKLSNEEAETISKEGKKQEVGVEQAGTTFVAGIALAETAKAGVKSIASAVGTEEGKAEAIGEGIRLGIYARTITKGIMELSGRNGGNAGTYIGVAVAAWYILNNYKDLEEKTINFECNNWEAPTGGRNCERCNDYFFGCSEYQCKSLGKGCELLNTGTDEEICAWVNRNDATPPVISVWEDALDRDYSYSEDDAQTPPDYGVVIYPENELNGCVGAYTELNFGISLNEPGICKIDLERTSDYESMSYYFGSSSTAKYNHTHIMSLPSIDANGTIIEEGGNMSLYVRCEDANGNSNTGEFVFKFCVEAGDDFTPPLVVQTEPVSGNPVAYNISQIGTTAYVNERVDECKWDFTDKNFADMNFSMDCSADKQVVGGQVLFPCTTTITAIKDREKNDYFIRCNDTSGNINKESYELDLIGTQPLYIDSVEPNDTTVKDSVAPVKVVIEVETSSGANSGASYCYYKASNALSYVQFLYDPVEMTHQHTQELYFEGGTYNYNIKCVDAGGNAAYENITFDVEEDLDSPIIVRAYKEEGYLKLITDEEGECVYNNDKEIGCEYEFADGISMQTVDENEHFVEWNSKDTFYIKCRDLFENPPLYDECSIVVRPSQGETL